VPVYTTYIKVILNTNNKKEIEFLHHFHCHISVSIKQQQQQVVPSSEQNKLHNIAKQIFPVEYVIGLSLNSVAISIRSTSVYFIRFSSLFYMCTQKKRKEKKNSFLFPSLLLLLLITIK
jgi:hypothetical protein